MYTVPAARAWWPAVGAPLERGVRRHQLRTSRGVRVSSRFATEISPYVALCASVTVQDAVVLWVGNSISLGSGSNDQASDCCRALVPQRVSYRNVRLEGDCVASLKYRLNISFNHRDFSFKYVHQFILVTVPVVDRRTCSRLKNVNEDAKLCESGRLAQPSLIVWIVRVEVWNYLDVLVLGSNDWHGCFRILVTESALLLVCDA
jgi:hypothetical protein